MPTTWNQTELQRYINDGVEESLTLDYKAGDALGTSDGKKKEITKDVSAMANSAGGTIIYGIKEYNEDDKKHLPEKFAPVDRTQFSKEWLQQIINSIQPHIDGVIIHSVNLSTGFTDVAYVVEIPQSTTAHQARDKKYYKRFNFLSEAMEHYEIRDVMNRVTLPDVNVEFTHSKSFPDGLNPEYRLGIVAQNHGVRVVERYKLVFTFPSFENQVTLTRISAHTNPYYGFYEVQGYDSPAGSGYRITYRSKSVLFPQEGFNIGNIANLRYKIDAKLHHELMTKKNTGNEITVKWLLYADDMPPKSGEIPFSSLYDSDK
jgi:schlafen family protein